MWPAGGENDATSQYRLLKPAEALISQGADVEISYRGPTVYWSKSWKGLPEPPTWVEVVGCAKPEADVVVIQRPARRWWADVTPHLQAHGVKVVVDVDDRFDRIHKRNVAYAGYNPKTGQTAHDADWVDRACRLADLVTCSTPALVQRYGHGHGVVLPNLVPEGYLWIFGDKRPNTVGWTGSVDTHPGDLEVTGGALRSIRPDWSLHVIGTGVKVREALGYRGDMTVSGWVPFSEYADKYAELELAIVPLAQCEFNEAKSSLKAIEAAALSVPVIMSPTPDNVRMHKEGIGVLAASPGQWRRQLRRLTADSDARMELADRGRTAMERFTFEARADRWLAAWESTVAPLRKAA